MDFGAPFGGYKESGIGRELGPEGLAGYLEYKSVSLPAGWTPPNSQLITASGPSTPARIPSRVPRRWRLAEDGTSGGGSCSWRLAS